MALVSLKSPEWVLNLSTEELRLVLKALGGRLKPEEYEEARNLGNILSKFRTTATEHSLRENAKLLENLDKG